MKNSLINIKMFLNNQKKVLVILIGISVYSNIAWAAPITSGYWAPGNILGVDFEGKGTIFQQNDPATNPNLFCSFQNKGYVLPDAGIINVAYVNKQPMTGNSDTTNGDFNVRKSGGLLNEWGSNLTVYSGSGWLGDRSIWLSEPFDSNNRTAFAAGTLNNGSIYGRPVDSTLYVVCMRNLI